MTRRTSPEPVSWVQIEGDGAEQVRTGHVWCPGPLPRSVWAVPDDPRPGESPVVLVSTPSRRIRCGRMGISAFRSTGGRVIEVGEKYAETHERSVLGSIAHRRPDPPGHVRSPKIPPEALASFIVLGGGPPGDVHEGKVAGVEGLAYGGTKYGTLF